MLRRVALTLTACAAAGLSLPGFAQQQDDLSGVRVFETPEAAVKAFVTAMRAPTIEPLAEIVGKPVLDSVPPEERRSDDARQTAGEELADQPVTITYDDEARTRARAVVGSEGFKLPTPLVQTAKGWAFDGEAGIAEMRQNRIAVNEGNAIRALHAFARAQEIYQQRDRNGDGILEYATRIRGTPGYLDGLVNAEAESVPGPTTSLLNEAFADAEGSPGNPQLHPTGGYGYRVLTAQGPNAEGGEQNYVVNGRMTEGFAIVAWPTRPADSGESTFIMNREGVIFEHEFGDLTPREVDAITAFDPGPGWTKVEE